MDTKIEVSPEELEAEKQALLEKKEEEVRASIITEYGFDEVDDIDRIDKLTKREMDHYKKLGAAVNQKLNLRKKLEEAGAKKPEAPEKKEEKTNGLTPEEVDKKLDERLDQRDLDAMDLSDEIKKSVQNVAKTQGISLKQALKDPYIVFQVGQYNKENKVEDAGIGRTNRTGGRGSGSFDTPPVVDMTTKEGRDKWDEWKEDQKKKGH